MAGTSACAGHRPAYMLVYFKHLIQRGKSNLFDKIENKMNFLCLAVIFSAKQNLVLNFKNSAHFQIVLNKIFLFGCIEYIHFKFIIS
jgi:hypothetical protein